MNRCSFCEWIPIVPGRVWPLAGHARLGQNTVVGSMAILLSWLCWGACQEEVCLDPHFLCNLTPPRLNVELPGDSMSPFSRKRVYGGEIYNSRLRSLGFRWRLTNKKRSWNTSLIFCPM